MVHVRDAVLAKTYAALRPAGLLYLSQPVPEDALVVARVQGAVRFEARLAEPNFLRYVHAGNRVIDRVVEHGLFELVQETVTEAELAFDSVDAWQDGLLGFGEDAENIYAMAAAMREAIGRRETSITVYSQDRAHLLRRPAG